MRSSNKFTAAFAVACGLVFSTQTVLAGSELDPKIEKAPAGIIKKLDTVNKTVTTYRVDNLDPSLSPTELAKLNENDRKAKLATVIASVEKPANLISVEPAVMEKSELDKSSSTPAWGWRHRGYYGGYYGRGFYGGYGYGGWGGGYGYSNYYYRPYWNYSGYYGNSYYYPGTYYGNYSYGYPYYSYYSYYPW